MTTRTVTLRYHVGQRVTFFGNEHEPARVDEWGNKWPQFEKDYTIRAFVDVPGMLGFHLVEIVNEKRWSVNNIDDQHPFPAEVAFSSERFRPADRTSILISKGETS